MALNFVQSALSQKCPRCRKGELFHTSTYNLRGFTKMYDSCSVCKQSYILEPSFFDGAMYVSYALQVALFVTVFVAIQVLHPEAEIGWYIGGVIALVVVLYPIIFRLSRSIWIHFFVRFDPGTKDLKKQ
ncbi:MAG: DUF983 domain-containing protein [Bacteroidota bacterium]